MERTKVICIHHCYCCPLKSHNKSNAKQTLYFTHISNKEEIQSSKQFLSADRVGLQKPLSVTVGVQTCIS